MRRQQNTFGRRQRLLVLAKASPLRACLSLFSRQFKTALVVALLLAGAAVFVAGGESVNAAATTKEACDAQGGEWKNTAPAGGVPKMGCVGGAPIKGMTLEEQVKFATDLTAATGCVKDHMKGSFTMGDGSRTSGYDWPIAPFDSESSKGLALMNKEVSCVDLFMNMVEAAGYGLYYGPVFDAIGYTFVGRQSDGDRYEGDPNPRDRSLKFYNLILSRVGSKPSATLCNDLSTDPTTCTPPTAAMKYLIAWKALHAGTCDPNDKGLYDSATKRTKELIEQGVKTVNVGTKKATVDVKIPILKEDGTLENHIYQIAYGNEGDKEPTAKQRTYGSFEPSCVELASDLDNYAKAYAGYMKMHPNEKPTDPRDQPSGEPTDGTGGEPESSCNIDGIGWILCPVLTAGANLADGTFGFLADNFLQVNTGLLGTDPNTIYVNDAGNPVNVSNGSFIAWGVMRNIANAAFIIVFLIIIFSQLSSVGVSNYGVKKLLPRLVVSAVLVNISFYLCQILVDLSNITGYGLKQALDSVSTQVAEAGGLATVDAGSESGHVGGIVALVIAGGALVWMNLGAVGLGIIAGVFVLLTIFVLLIVRQALVVLLIVVAPLAFVAFLLPNTEALFTRWRKMFTAMLLLFPIIGLLFGASNLASTVLMQVAGSNVALQVAAYMALVVPLIAVIPLLRGSLDAIPAIGNAIQNAGRRSSSTAQGGAKRGADAYKNSDWGKFRAGLKAERRSRVRAGEYQGRGGVLNPWNWKSRTNRVINDSAAFNAITGGFGSRRGKSAAKWEGKEISEKAETLAGYLDSAGLPIDPQAHFDSMLAKQRATYSNPGSSEKVRRDARIDLAAAQAHLIRSNGQAGSEYAREQIAYARGDTAGRQPPARTESHRLSPVQIASIHEGIGDTTSSTQDSGLPVTNPVSMRLQDEARKIGRSNDYARVESSETQLTRDQIRSMGEEHVQAFADKNGGVSALSEGNLLRISNSHGSTDVGREARQELINRGVIKGETRRDDRTMPKP